jgi:hypothetical protein
MSYSGGKEETLKKYDSFTEYREKEAMIPAKKKSMNQLL